MSGLKLVVLSDIPVTALKPAQRDPHQRPRRMVAGVVFETEADAADSTITFRDKHTFCGRTQKKGGITIISRPLQRRADQSRHRTGRMAV